MVKFGWLSMKEISVYLGHKSVNVTERVYAKYSPNFMKESAKCNGRFYFLKQVQIALSGIWRDFIHLSY